MASKYTKISGEGEGYNHRKKAKGLANKHWKDKQDIETQRY